MENNLYIDYGKYIFERNLDEYYNKETKLLENVPSYRYPRTYTDVKYSKDVSDCPEALKLHELDYLYEGLVTTASISLAMSKLKEFEDAELIDVLLVEKFPTLGGNEKTPYISFLMPNEFYHPQKSNPGYSQILDCKIILFRTIENLGYFVAIEETFSKNKDFTYFAIHPKFIIEVTDLVYSKPVNGVLYHITLEKNLRKMNKNGLIPRNSLTYEKYPDRVYFFWKMIPESVENHINEHFKKFKKQKEQVLRKAVSDFTHKLISLETFKYIVNNRYDYRRFAILKVDLKNKRLYSEDDITTQYKFFDDPKSPGIFTYENIDPLCIDVYKTVSFKDTDDFEFVLDYLP